MAMAAPPRVSKAEQLPFLERRILFHPARDNAFSSATPPPGIQALNSGFEQALDASDAPVVSPKQGIKRSWEQSNAETGSRDDQSLFLDSAEGPPLKIGAGLENLGNTCFLNSVLQCLTYTSPLAKFLRSRRHKQSCGNSGFCAMCALEFHVNNALQGTGRVVSPKYLVKNLQNISRTFQPWRQEDAHEYLRYLMEALQKACLPDRGRLKSHEQERSLIYSIFGGRLKSEVKCTNCLQCSETFEPCLDLSLDIHRADTLGKALACFTANEILDGDNKYHCERCKKKVRAVKRFTVETAPHILTIHLKRFSSTGIYGEKINKKVIFGRRLDITPFMSNAKDGAVYELYGVLVHEGWSTRSGHYFCFIRTSADLWHVLDDNKVRQVSEQTVLDQKAYILFYRQRPKQKENQPPRPVSNAMPSTSKPLERSPLKAESNKQRPGESLPNTTPETRVPAATPNEVTVTASPNPEANTASPEVQRNSAATTSIPEATSVPSANARPLTENSTSEPERDAEADDMKPETSTKQPEVNVSAQKHIKADKLKGKAYLKLLRNMPKGRRMSMVAALEEKERPTPTGEGKSSLVSNAEGTTKKKKQADDTKNKTSSVEPPEDVVVSACKLKATSPSRQSSASANELFGSEVARWDDVDGKQIDSFLKTEHRATTKKLDEWDEEYDRGKVKKVRRVAGGGRLTPCKSNDRKSNPFQVLASNKRKPKT